MFNDAPRASEIILTFEECYRDIGCQVCKKLSQIVFGRWQLQALREIKVYHAQVRSRADFLVP